MASITLYQRGAGGMIKNLRPGLVERGKIKIGVKGELRQSQGGKEFQPPKKLDHFVVTGLGRGQDGNFLRDEEVHSLHGDKPTSLPVRLLYNDLGLNFTSGYLAYEGKQLWCSGDGEAAIRRVDPQRTKPDEVIEALGDRHKVRCPCHRLEAADQGVKCKPFGTLSVLIDGIGSVGGVYKFRTTSWNSLNQLYGSMQTIAGMSGGILAGLPLDLVIRPKATTTPDGKATTIWTVSLEYRGTLEELRERALKLATADASYELRMRRVEEQARLLQAPAVDPDDAEIVDEFFPQQAAAANGASYVDGDAVDPATGEVMSQQAGLASPGEKPELITINIPMGGGLKALELPGDQVIKRLEAWTQKAPPAAVAALVKANAPLWTWNPALRGVVLQLSPGARELLETEGL